MSTTTVFAAEAWMGSHWKTVEGGLTREEAEEVAAILRRDGHRASVAEYSADEGTSALSRTEAQS